MMSFDRDQFGWLYIIENRKLKARKFGITNNLESRLNQHGRDWEVVYANRNNGVFISVTETLLKKFISDKLPLRTVTYDEMRHTGFTETFKMSRRLSNRKIVKYIRNLIEALQNQ
jgi:hypothetical protein